MMENMSYRYPDLLAPLAVLLLLSGCASLAHYPDNPPLEQFDRARSITGLQERDSGDILLVMTFSGGGSRAAALAYGVLAALADTPAPGGLAERSLLDETDIISAVSGGSVTAAYFGLYGERLFIDFRARFLERDGNAALRSLMMTPGNLSRLGSETFGSGDILDEYFAANLFGDAPLRQLVDADGPLVQINATDLFKGGQFGFTAEQFALICSDIDRFPVSRAVAASSAVPVIFAPLTLTNRAGTCGYATPAWLRQDSRVGSTDNRRERLARYLATYLDRDEHPYIHLVDGGLADNLGLRAILHHIVIAGGLWNTLQRFNLDQARDIVLITVDASALLPSHWEQTDRTPSTMAIVDAATTTPLMNYNFETLEYLRSRLPEWRNELRRKACRDANEACDTPDIFLIDLRLEDIADPRMQERLTTVPTDFSLPSDVIDDLIDAGHSLLHSHPEYRRLMNRDNTRR
jgi:NTE family protein